MRFIWSIAVGISIFVGATAPSIADSILFSDSFDRPNSSTVGNAWLDLSGNVNGNLIVQNGSLTTPNPDGNAGIYRPIDFSFGGRIQGTLTQQNGYGGTLERYASGFSIFNDGTLYNGNVPNGLSVMFYRGDQNYNNSAVRLYVNGSLNEVKSSTFQFGSAISFDTQYKQGNLTGTVSSGSNSFNFQFAVPNVPSGKDFAAYLGFPDGRSGVITNPKLAIS